MLYIGEKKENITYQERKCAYADGYYWDKVKISSGVVGYMASQYLEPCEEVKNAMIEGTNVKAIPNTTVKTMVNELGITSYEVTKEGTKKNDNDKLATGYKLKDTKNNKEYNIIVLGDVNGDGKALAIDALSILKHSTKATSLKGLYLTAADINGDGKVLATDALQTLKHSTGNGTISL